MEDIQGIRLNIGVAIAFLLYFLFLFILGFSYPGDVGLIVLLITGFAVLFSSFLLINYYKKYVIARQVNQENCARKTEKKSNRKLLLALSVPVFYFILFWLVGYFIATAILLLFVPRLFAKPKLYSVLIAASIILLVVWAVFFQFLSIRPYTGVLL